MLRDDVVAAFLEEYAAETCRLEEASISTRPELEAELSEVDQQITQAKTAILKGVETSRTFVGPVARRARRYIERLLPGADPGFGDDLGLALNRPGFTGGRWL
ncbi:hypothetical protein [Sphingomonas carotinifaciens]|uniref:hypothetical protein n=1 Tax=Sphingomonas carotinifaciens TaxID=1166323 RepID=UPI0012377F99|nr:hypothetical protein [Sphingomonas carotinifaciens]